MLASSLLLLVLVGAASLSTADAYVYWRNATKRSVGSVVPRPKQIRFTNGLDYLEIARDNLQFELRGQQLANCGHLKRAVARYHELLLFDDARAPENKDDPAAGKRARLGPLYSVQLAASPGKGAFVCEKLPHAHMDEAYNLTVSSSKGGDPGEARIEARTNWGLLRALETLSQLVFRLPDNLDNPNDSIRVGASRFAIRPVKIQDEPRFKYRGFMLDTARHYISLNNILVLLDAMAYNKLNVFHWHLVDDQSFPWASETFPQLAKRSAFRPELIYTRQQVIQVVNYAAELGIRVVPELDTPGHSYALRHIPGVLTQCYDSKSAQPNDDFGPVDPTKETAYQTVDKLITEMGQLFGESMFHAGGDEVDFDCWKSSPLISNWMAEHNITGNYEELSNVYLRRLHELLAQKHNKTMIVWQEVFDMGAQLPNSKTIVHVWKNINDKSRYLPELNRVISAGYHALLSSCWYLNYIDYGQDWVKFYQCDPRAHPIEPARAYQVLGGEICMWTEFADDSNVISRTWPRASAAAERLWSPMNANDTQEFLHRLEQHRCRLRARGVNAEPVNGPGYC